MLQPIRRVVTGQDADGRSVIVSDANVDNSNSELPFWPGTGTTSVWTTPSAPASNLDEDLPAEITGFAPAGGGGVGFMVMELRPEAELADMPPDQHALATTPVARLFPEAHEIDTSKSFQMHATDSVDLIIVLSGEITLLVDEGEVTLKPFDTVVQRGVNHGWVNRGTVPALLGCAVVDAQPLERKPHDQVDADVQIGEQ